MSKIYIDANVFVHHLFNIKNKYQTSSAFLKSIENSSTDVGIVSTLTIIETFTSGKHILAEKNHGTIVELDTIVKEAIKYFFETKNLEIIPRPDDDCKLHDIFSQAYHFINTYKGKIAYDDEHKRYYDGFYAPDVIHLALALKYKCDRLVTTDGDFDEVPNDVISVKNIK